MSTITALNGRIPADQLVVVDTGENGPQRLHESVAPIWAAMLAAGMPPGCLTSGYRDRAEQDRLKAQGLTVAAGGTSEHGEGTAADIAEPGRTWVHQHAPEWGLKFTVPGELWHTYLGDAHTPAAPAPAAPQEDTMLTLIRVIYGGAVWVGNGIARRKINSQDEDADVKYQIEAAGGRVIDRGQVARIDWLGEDITGAAHRVEQIQWAVSSAHK